LISSPSRKTNLVFSIWAFGECILTFGKALSIPFTPDVWSL